MSKSFRRLRNPWVKIQPRIVERVVEIQSHVGGFLRVNIETERKFSIEFFCEAKSVLLVVVDQA